MAIKIPIVTVFENKGIRDAERQLAKISGNFQNLGRNFAVAGAALAGVSIALGKTITAASNLEAEFEGVNQVFGSAATSVQDFAKQASESAGITETAALQASKVFGLFATGAGLSQKEAAKFSTTMVQLAGDLGSFNDVPTEEALAAIQSGLQGQSEPLRRFGVFLDDARLRAEALNLGIYNGKGPLNQQQKMMAAYEAILKQTNIQQGDFVKYSDTYGNQLKTLQAEFGNLSAEIGATLLPVMADIIPVIRDVVAELGPKLKAAMSSVDWAALATSFGQVLTFLIQNLEMIVKVAAAMWTLNTAYNAVRVAIGLFNAVALITNTLTLGWATKYAAIATSVATTGTAFGGASIGVGLFSTALRLVPGVAALGWIALMIQGATEVDSSYRHATPVVASFGTIVRSSGKDSEWASKKYGVATQKVGDYANSANLVEGISFSGHRRSIAQIKADWENAKAAAANYAKIAKAGLAGASADRMEQFLTKGKNKGDETAASTAFGGTSTGAGKKKLSPIKQLKADLGKQVKMANLTKKLVNQKGFSEGFAGMILGGKAPIKTAKKILAGTAKGIKKLQNLYKKSPKGIAEASAASEKASAQAREASQSAADAAAEAAQKEADAADKKKQTYDSLLDSIKSTFGQIREQILGAFTLDTLGNSTDSIIRNMNKLLTKTRQFAQNISALSGLGLNTDLLNQVIQQGPVAGAALADALVKGGTTALAEINAGYNEMGMLSSQIAQTGTSAAFGTQAQQNIYNIEVNGGVGSGPSIGAAIVDAIKAYERVSGAVWQGA